MDMRNLLMPNLKRRHDLQTPTYAARRGGDDDQYDGTVPGPTAALVDQHVGKRILERRMILGLSLQQLAVLIGVTYQQAHKYERGLNRITAGRLYDISQALGVHVAWFFEGLTGAPPIPEVSPRLRLSLELARNFAAISNEKHKEALSHLARALAQEHSNAEAAEQESMQPQQQN
jgi:transcriptional regulator with XRE-family HTH domain